MHWYHNSFAVSLVMYLFCKAGHLAPLFFMEAGTCGDIHPNPATTIASIDCVCHCERPRGAWQSLQKRRDCGACSERSEESPRLLQLWFATTPLLAITWLLFLYSR